MLLLYMCACKVFMVGLYHVCIHLYSTSLVCICVCKHETSPCWWCLERSLSLPPAHGPSGVVNKRDQAPHLPSISLARASWVISSFVSLVLLAQVILIIIFYIYTYMCSSCGSLLIFVFLHCSHSAANWTIPIAVCTISTILHIIYTFLTSLQSIASLRDDPAKINPVMTTSMFFLTSLPSSLSFHPQAFIM